MKLDISPLINSISSFLRRYHFLIFFVFIVGSLCVGVLMLYSAIQLSDEANGYTPPTSDTSFDQDTIDRLRDLKQSSQETQKLPVTGRVSPF